MQIKKNIILLLFGLLPLSLNANSQTTSLATIDNNVNLILEGKYKALETIKVKIYNTEFRDDFYYAFIKTDKDGNYKLTQNDIKTDKLINGKIAFELTTNQEAKSQSITSIYKLLEKKIPTKSVQNNKSNDVNKKIEVEIKVLESESKTFEINTIDNSKNLIFEGKYEALETIKVKIYNTQYKDDFYNVFIKTDQYGVYRLTQNDIDIQALIDGKIAFELSTNKEEKSKSIVNIYKFLDKNLELSLSLKASMGELNDNIVNNEESKSYIIEGVTESNLRELRIVLSDINDNRTMYTMDDISLDQNGKFRIKNIDLSGLKDGMITVKSIGYDIADNKAETLHSMLKDTIVSKPILLKNIKNNNLSNIVNKKILVASGTSEPFSTIEFRFKQKSIFVVETIVANKNGEWELLGGDLNLDVFKNGKINVSIYQIDVAKNKSKALEYINEKFPIPIFPLVPEAIDPLKYQLLYIINEHDDEIKDIFINKTDLFVATYGYLKVWGKSYAKFKGKISVGDRWVNSVIVDKGKIYIALSDGYIHIHDEKTLRLLKKLKIGKLPVLNLKVKNEYLIAASASGSIKVWNKENFQEIYENKSHQWDIKAIALDGDYLYSGSDDYSIKKINLYTNKLAKTLKSAHTGTINDIVIYKEYLISASDDKKIIVRNLSSGKIHKVLLGHKGAVKKLSIVNDFLVSVSSDRSMIFWDISNGTMHKKIKAHNKMISALDINDFNIVTGSRDKKVKIWGYNESLKILESENETKMEKYALLKSLDFKKGFPTSLAQNENEIIIASDKGQIYFYNIATHNYVKKYSTLDELYAQVSAVRKKGDDEYEYDDEALELPLKLQKIHSIDNYGNKLLAGLDDTSIKIWDMESNRAIESLGGLASPATDISISSLNVLAGTKKGNVGVYDIESKEFINLIEGHQYNVNSITLFEDDKVISAGDDYSIKIRDIESGDTLLDIKNAHTDIITKLAIYNNLLISASLDGTIKVRNIESGKLIKILDLHKAGVTALALDYDTLISASIDNTLIAWNLEDFTKIAIMDKHTSDVVDIMIAGDYIISIAKDKTIKVWKYYE